MALEQRFLTGFREEATLEPGLVQENDGTIWLVDPDGTRHQLPGSGGTGCPYLTCEGDVAVLTTGSVFLRGQSDDAAEAYLGAIDELGVTYAGFDAAMTDGKTVARALISAQMGGDLPGANLALRAEQGGTSYFILSAGVLAFNGGEGVARPTLDPATATAQDVAQALIDLGLSVQA